MRTLPLVALVACNPGNPQVEDTSPEVPFTCEADHDGVIEAGELAASVGISADYEANAAGTEVAVDVVGTLEDGTRTWDFREGPFDVRTNVRVEDPAGAWFADAFPDATRMAAIWVHAPGLMAVFQDTDDAVLLLGVASTEEDPPEGRTLVVYEEPAPVFRFPLEPGTTWTAETSFRNATVAGVANAGSESWAFAADDEGTVLLPGYAFTDVLRLRVDLAQEWDVAAGEGPWSWVEYLWVAECFGELARAVSLAGETDPAFTVASEVRRLATD